MIQIMGSAGMQMYLKLADLPWVVRHKTVPRNGIGGKANIFTFIKPWPSKDAPQPAAAKADTGGGGA